MLAAAGAEIERGDGAVAVKPAGQIEPAEIVVPADFSSAAFFIVAALLVPGSEISLAGVGLNPTRTGLLAILRRMGAEIKVELEGERGGEPIGHIRARPFPLHGVEIGGAEVPLAIDGLPLVALAACFAEGATTIRDAAKELRRKESDRIATVSETLSALGGLVEATEDGIAIKGSGGLRGGTVHSHGDHRIAMLGAVAGLASREGVKVEGMDAAAVSYPGFEADLPRSHGDRDRRPGRGWKVLGGPWRCGCAWLHLSRLGGDVSLRGAGGDRARRRPRRRRGDDRDRAGPGDRLRRRPGAELQSRRLNRDPLARSDRGLLARLIHPGVREALVARQRQMIAAGSYVAEGRDIGTVVSPDSPLKVFLTASDEERARRRAVQTGEDPGAVLASQRERDRRDETREHSALRAASDAVEIDTTGLGLDDVVARVVELARERGLG